MTDGGAYVVQPAQRSTVLRVLTGIIAFALTLGGLVTAIVFLFTTLPDGDAGPGYVSAGMLTWSLFFWVKTAQAYKRPLWNGTLRWIIACGALHGLLAIVVTVLAGAEPGLRVPPVLPSAALLGVIGLMFVFPGRSFRRSDFVLSGQAADGADAVAAVGAAPEWPAERSHVAFVISLVLIAAGVAVMWVQGRRESVEAQRQSAFFEAHQELAAAERELARAHEALRTGAYEDAEEQRATIEAARVDLAEQREALRRAAREEGELAYIDRDGSIVAQSGESYVRVPLPPGPPAPPAPLTLLGERRPEFSGLRLSWMAMAAGVAGIALLMWSGRYHGAGYMVRCLIGGALIFVGILPVSGAEFRLAGEVWTMDRLYPLALLGAMLVLWPAGRRLRPRAA